MTINNKYISKRREKEAAKDIGGRAHPGSGCFWSIKSDCSNATVQVEDKFTKETSYALQISILKKIQKEAFEVGKTPLLRFGFEIASPYNKDYCVLNKNHCIQELDVDSTITIKGNSRILHAEDLYKTFYKVDKNIIVQVEYLKTNDIYYIMLWDFFKENHTTLVE